MASPPSGAEASKVSKDRNCPFCQQAFTSSSLGRHLDLYIKSKNPKPPDGVHDVDEIRKMRGNITRRQSRVASIKRDSVTPAGPASARYILDDKQASTPDPMRRVGWTVNRPGWEATGVINDLPPRIEPRPVDRRDSSKRDHLKADLDQRQKLADELDTGRAAQLALKEILDTVRNAEYVDLPGLCRTANTCNRASTTGRHLFDDFDFFQQSFPALCLRLLKPSTPLDSALCITASDTWSSNTPWEQQRDALSRVVEERGQILKRKDSLLSSAYEETSIADLNLEKFHQHINHVFDLWSKINERTRDDAWQREIIRSYARMETELKEAKATITALKRDAELLARRLEHRNSNYSPYQGSFSDRGPSLSVPPTPLGLSDDVLRDLSRFGVNTREWDYERLVDRWKSVVRDERRASSGLSAQRNFSTTSQQPHGPSNLSINGAPQSTMSRSVSVASAVSATAPTRTSSMDSAAMDADAEGEEEDMEADNVAPDAHSYTRKPHEHEAVPHLPMNNYPRHILPNAQIPAPTMVDPRMSSMPHPASQQHIDNNYKWPQHEQATSTPSYHPSLAEHSAVKRLPPGPDSWHAEVHHAVAHNMEGIEGPATTGAPTS